MIYGFFSILKKVKIPKMVKNVPKKSRIRETKHLSTNGDSSTAAKKLLRLIHIEFGMSHNNKLNNKINLLVCTFLKASIYENKKKYPKAEERLRAVGLT